MHSRGIVRRLMEEFEGARETQIGILDAQCGRWNRGKVSRHDDGRGLGEARRAQHTSD